MLTVTKVFRFETAHAILRHPGSCANIHGHSYELHVTVAGPEPVNGYFPGTGIMIDFKDLKAIVRQAVVDRFDHKLILSRAYLQQPGIHFNHAELIEMEAEPTAENLLLMFRHQIQQSLPTHIQLRSIRLWETRDSYAEWTG